MLRLLDRHWLLTSTTYATWLPGDERGFVSPVRAEGGGLELHNVPATPYDRDMPALSQHARGRVRGAPVLLNRAQAEAVCRQLQETAIYRGWRLIAASVMCNHMHILVTVPGDPAPKTLLQSFKAYASRILNQRWTKPESGTWWTESGSKRKLPSEEAVRAATCYVCNQPGWLARYVDPEVPLEWYARAASGGRESPDAPHDPV